MQNTATSTNQIIDRMFSMSLRFLVSALSGVYRECYCDNKAHRLYSDQCSNVNHCVFF